MKARKKDKKDKRAQAVQGAPVIAEAASAPSVSPPRKKGWSGRSVASAHVGDAHGEPGPGPA